MLTVLYCWPTVALQDRVAGSPRDTATSEGGLFQMGGWTNTGAGKLSRFVECLRTSSPRLASQVYVPESKWLTSIMIRDWFWLKISSSRPI